MGYTYKIHEYDNTVCIVDDGTGKSVTNDAENILTKIAKEHPEIKSMKVLYKDTEGTIDGMIPEWKLDKCVDVSFRSLNLSNFNEPYLL